MKSSTKFLIKQFQKPNKTKRWERFYTSYPVGVYIQPYDSEEKFRELKSLRIDLVRNFKEQSIHKPKDSVHVQLIKREYFILRNTLLGINSKYLL